MEFGSIHSVKGRTHLATLVLETFMKSHNMKSILDYLCGEPPKRMKSSSEKIKMPVCCNDKSKSVDLPCYSY